MEKKFELPRIVKKGTLFIHVNVFKNCKNVYITIIIIIVGVTLHIGSGS